MANPTQMVILKNSAFLLALIFKANTTCPNSTPSAHKK
ncbi:hypothetical protein NHE_0303 [Neorickettsia helminthoeca str. Oregon]|uniref:Uncharacterized protein n=1 Tax=Neorickettsia helminthoeca str. Oregon TaxID=1286528 RepID=X5GW10_9RICK|nr:hypothetical protein NHE_0303 [Neorickettsia helminthoeca str. Oregon]